MILALRKLRTSIGGKPAVLEVADSDISMQAGLSGRVSLVPDHGMLFDPGKKCSDGFFMRNTLVPLTVAFADEDGTIYEKIDLTPMSETIMHASKPWRYAVEMDQGWFDDCEDPCIIAKRP